MFLSTLVSHWEGYTSKDVTWNRVALCSCSWRWRICQLVAVSWPHLPQLSSRSFMEELLSVSSCVPHRMLPLSVHCVFFVCVCLHMGYATNKTLVAVAFHWSSDSWLAYTSQCSEEERRESSSLQVSDLASCCDHPRDFIQSQSSQHCLKKCLSTGTAGSASQSQYSRGWSWATWFSHSEPQEPNHQLGMSSLGKTIISTLFFSSQTFILKSRMLLVYLDYPATGAWLNSENVR